MQCDIAQAGGVVEKVCGGSKIAEERGKKGRERPVSLSAPGKEGKTVFLEEQERKVFPPAVPKSGREEKEEEGGTSAFYGISPSTSVSSSSSSSWVEEPGTGRPWEEEQAPPGGTGWGGVNN